MGSKYLRHVGKGHEVWLSTDFNQEHGFESWFIEARKSLPG